MTELEFRDLIHALYKESNGRIKEAICQWFSESLATQYGHNFMTLDNC